MMAPVGSCFRGGTSDALLLAEFRESMAPAIHDLPSSRSTTQQPRACGARTAAVVEDVGIVAAGVLQGVGEDGEAVEGSSLDSRGQC